MIRAGMLMSAMLVTVVLAGCAAPPENVECRAASDGNHLSWDAAENATSYNVYRFAGEANATESEFLNATPIGNTTTTTFHDANVTAGTTYQYFVTSVNEEGESLPGELCIVTAIPEFPSIAVAGLAGAAALVGFVLLRRRG